MAHTIAPSNVHETLRQHLIADGFPIVFDLQKSSGSRVIDAVTGTEYIDCYSFFSSLPLGFAHPAFEDPTNRERLLSAALLKPSNSDADTPELASFVSTFARDAMPEPFRHLFFIEGGALAVENALKAAFDWKVRKNLAAGRGEKGSRILHFNQAFHGRSGYTMSLTNTDPRSRWRLLSRSSTWPRVSAIRSSAVSDHRPEVTRCGDRRRGRQVDRRDRGRRWSSTRTTSPA